MIVCDWSPLSPNETAPLYAAETRRWNRDLAWDTIRSWTAIELARTTWGLPGLICLDITGTIRGWTFYLPRQHRCDIGSFVSDSREATTELVDALIACAGSPQRLSGVIYASAPDLIPVMTSRGVPLVRHSYCWRELRSARTAPRTRIPGVMSGAGSVLRQWSEADLEATAELLYDSYGDRGGLVGPDATVQDWRGYVSNLAQHEGCGRLSPTMSRVLTLDGSVAAVSLVSAIAPRTAHLVQLVVRRAQQGAGIGRALVATTIKTARDNRHDALSLLVAEDNVPALRLYRQAGFVERATFIALGTSGHAVSATERSA